MMASTRLYSFISMNLPANTFHVVSYLAREELSKPYFFDIQLVSEKADICMDDVMEGNARLAFNYANMRLQYHGLVYRFEHQRSVDRHHYYKALLAPRLWALGMNRHSQVFLDKTVPEILEQVLLESELLSAKDIEFRLAATYPRREYVCQYNESHLDFISRWCEREGIYYFFEQQEHGERLVLTDTLLAHEPLPRQPVLRYRPVSGLEPGTAMQIATSFVCEQNLVPRSMQLRDYNYRHPSLNLDSGQEQVEQGLYGDVYSYGENLKSMEEVSRLAKVRAEEAKVRQTIFKGVGRAPFVRSGFLFTLVEHSNDARNIDYLTLKVKRHGNQHSYLADALGISVPDQEERKRHSITFTAIAANVQFRPARTTPWPRIYGAMNARVEAEGPSQYADLDEQGRYKVRLPFDVSDSPKGKASARVRMGQPYAGAGHGMHFPLLDGTEVLLTFIDGDVDRPVVTAALPNAESQSIVKSTNAPANAIRSASGNQLVFGDSKGQEFVGLYSGHAQSGISIGSHKPGGGGSVALSSHGVFEEFTGGGKIECSLGSTTGLVAGISSEVTVGIKSDVTAAIATEAALMSQVSYTRGDRIELGTESKTLETEVEVMGLEGVKLSGGINETVSKLVTRAKLALGLGVASSIVGGVGIAMLSRPFDDEFLKDGKQEWHKTPSLVSGGIATFTGVALATACAVTVRKIVNKVGELSEQAKTANVTLDNNGIDIKVNSSVTAAATLELDVGKKGTGATAKDKSSITISSQGSSILLRNKETAWLGLYRGTIFRVGVKDSNNRDCHIRLTKGRLIADIPDGGQMELGTNQGILTCNAAGGNPGKLTAKNDEALVSCGNADSISVKNDGVTVTASKTTFTVQGAFTVTAGSINIG